MDRTSATLPLGLGHEAASLLAVRRGLCAALAGGGALGDGRELGDIWWVQKGMCMCVYV